MVSAGNTGALLALAKIVIKTLPGIDRPAMAAIGPSARGDVVMLDLGANVQCDARNLVEFAVMGDVFARTVLGLTAPVDRPAECRVGGAEGRRHACARPPRSLRASHIGPQFHGFVEGHDIAAGTTDVVVTDGFTGNVALKTGEGALKLIGDLLRQVFTQQPDRQARLSAGAAGARPAARMARSAPLQRRGDARAERRGGEVAWRHRRAGLRPCGRCGDGHGGAPVQRPDPRGSRPDRGRTMAVGRPKKRRQRQAPATAVAAPRRPAPIRIGHDAHPFHSRRRRRLSARARRHQRRTGAQRRRPPTTGSASAPASASAISPAPHETARLHGHRGGARGAGGCRGASRTRWTRSSWRPARPTRRSRPPRCASRRRWA